MLSCHNTERRVGGAGLRLCQGRALTAAPRPASRSARQAPGCPGRAHTGAAAEPNPAPGLAMPEGHGLSNLSRVIGGRGPAVRFHRAERAGAGGQRGLGALSDPSEAAPGGPTPGRVTQRMPPTQFSRETDAHLSSASSDNRDT